MFRSTRSRNSVTVNSWKPFTEQILIALDPSTRLYLLFPLAS